MRLIHILCILSISLATYSSCKKQENSEIANNLKTFNFSCDTALVTADNNFLAVDYKTSSIIKISNSGTMLWKKSNLFKSTDYQNKLDEKPFIRTLNNGDFIICEQITDSFKANINQVYTHLLFSRINANGVLSYQKKHITSTKKKILPFNIIENNNNELVCIGVNETNEICGAISFFKTTMEGDLIANSNKTINTASYWLNGIFYNARTYLNTLATSTDLFAIFQIGTQTSCFKMDNDGKVILYRRFNYATEFDIQQQIDASSFWEYTISNFIKVSNSELLISGVKYSGQNYATTNSYLQHVFIAKINLTFDSIRTYRDAGSSFQYGSVPLVDDDGSYAFVGYDSDEQGGDSYLRVFKINADLTVKNRNLFSKLINYKGIASIANGDGSIVVIGNNSAFGSLSKHTFILKTKNEESL